MNSKSQAAQILRKALDDLHSRRVRAEMEGDYRHVEVLSHVILKIDNQLHHITEGNEHGKP